MANKFEIPGFSIDIDAVKDQLTILGHQVSDDVIVNFIKDVYLPQRNASSVLLQDSNECPPSNSNSSSLGASGGGGHISPFNSRSSGHQTYTAHASLSLADAVEDHDDVVVMSTADADGYDGDQMFGTGIGSTKHHTAQAALQQPDKLEPVDNGAKGGARGLPIQARGDSASDWDDTHGLEKLSLASKAPKPQNTQPVMRTAPFNADGLAGAMASKSPVATSSVTPAGQPASSSDPVASLHATTTCTRQPAEPAPTLSRPLSHPPSASLFPNPSTASTSASSSSNPMQPSYQTSKLANESSTRKPYSTLAPEPEPHHNNPCHTSAPGSTPNPSNFIYHNATAGAISNNQYRTSSTFSLTSTENSQSSLPLYSRHPNSQPSAHPLSQNPSLLPSRPSSSLTAQHPPISNTDSTLVPHHRSQYSLYPSQPLLPSNQEQPSLSTYADLDTSPQHDTTTKPSSPLHFTTAKYTNTDANTTTHSTLSHHSHSSTHPSRSTSKSYPTKPRPPPYSWERQSELQAPIPGTTTELRTHHLHQHQNTLAGTSSLQNKQKGSHPHLPSTSRPRSVGLSSEASSVSFIAPSVASSRARSSQGLKKVDRVQRYQQLAAGWQKDRFLKAAEGKPRKRANFHSHFAALHSIEQQQQHERKQAARTKTRADLAPAAEFQVPTAKRRDSLRWGVRVRMMQPPEAPDAY